MDLHVGCFYNRMYLEPGDPDSPGGPGRPAGPGGPASPLSPRVSDEPRSPWAP